LGEEAAHGRRRRVVVDGQPARDVEALPDAGVERRYVEQGQHDATAQLAEEAPRVPEHALVPIGAADAGIDIEVAVADPPALQPVERAERELGVLGEARREQRDLLSVAGRGPGRVAVKQDLHGRARASGRRGQGGGDHPRRPPGTRPPYWRSWTVTLLV